MILLYYKIIEFIQHLVSNKNNIKGIINFYSIFPEIWNNKLPIVTTL